MIKAVVVSSIFVAIAIWFPFHATAQSALPPAVAAHIQDDKKSCDTGEIEFSKGFVTTKDVNGDGKPDYILDYAHLTCGGSTLFCGSGGCTVVVFASTSSGYLKVFDDLVRTLTFKKINGRPAMLLGLHGIPCGKVGSAPCGETLYWNGDRFIAAH